MGRKRTPCMRTDEDGAGDGDGKAGAGGDEGGNREPGGDLPRESFDFSSEHLSGGSTGSMGSDIDEHEDDPFAAMEKDLQEQKEEEERKKGEQGGDGNSGAVSL